MDKALAALERVQRSADEAEADRAAVQAEAELTEAMARHFKRASERKRYLLEKAAKRCRVVEVRQCTLQACVRADQWRWDAGMRGWAACG